MNIPLPPVEMDCSHTLTIHLTAISLSMLMSDMMPLKHLHPLRGDMFMQLLVPRISTLLKNPTKHISFRIVTPHQMTFIRYIRPNIRSRHDDSPTSSKPLPELSLEDLVGRTFLLPPGDNGERLRAKVTRKVVEDIEKADRERIRNVSYILGIGNGKLEELISYNQLVDHVEDAANEDNEISDDLYKFRALIGHQGPLKPTDPNSKGCKFNVVVEWETGEKNYEPLSILAADVPVTCATYAKGNDLMHI